VLLQQLREPRHVAQRRSEVVRDRVREGLQLAVARLEVGGPPLQLLVQLADLLLARLPLRDLGPQPLAGFQELPLRAAADDAEPGEHRREEQERDEVRDVVRRDRPRVARFGEVVVEGERGEHDGDDRGPHARVPYGGRDREEEERELQRAKALPLEREGAQQRERDGRRRQEVRNGTAEEANRRCALPRASRSLRARERATGMGGDRSVHVPAPVERGNSVRCGVHSARRGPAQGRACHRRTTFAIGLRRDARPIPTYDGVGV
jgi:hypothetical protein